MDTNPYESPQTDCHAPENWQDSTLRVEGKHLVIPTGAVLPPVCVKTNRPVSEADMVRMTLYWCSAWVAILVFGGPLILLAFLLLKRFTITCGLAPKLCKRRRNLRLVRTVAMIGCFASMVLPYLVAFGLIASVPLDNAPAVIGWTLMIGMAVGFSLLFVAILSGIQPLSSRKYRDGMFWVKGCSEEYLARFDGEGDWTHSRQLG